MRASAAAHMQWIESIAGDTIIARFLNFLPRGLKPQRSGGYLCEKSVGIVSRQPA